MPLIAGQTYMDPGECSVGSALSAVAPLTACMAFLITELPVEDFVASSIEVQIIRFAGASCSGAASTVADGTSDDNNTFTGTDTPNAAGSSSYAATGGNLTSNCVDVIVNAVADSPTATSTAVATATMTTPPPTATATLDPIATPSPTGTISDPTATSTLAPGEPSPTASSTPTARPVLPGKPQATSTTATGSTGNTGSDGTGVTTLPSTGSQPEHESSVLTLMVLLGGLLLTLAIVATKKRRV